MDFWRTHSTMAPALLLICACSDSSESPSVYASGTSNVSYSGQTFRHVLILGMRDHLDDLTQRISEDPTWVEEGAVVGELEAFYDYDGSLSAAPHPITTEPATLQASYGDFNSEKTLAEKVAGNDAIGQHEDWSSAFAGWNASDPDGLVRSWFDELEALSLRRAQGEVALTPTAKEISKVYVTERGHDLQQLLQKFLLGAVAFSQGVDDYLDDDVRGKGLLSPTVPEDGEAYSPLEHAWDEAFGYFGAARDYGTYDDDEIAGAGGRPEYASGYHDSNNDGRIDLISEYNFGHAVNAAKRDRGSNEDAPTNLTNAAFAPFVEGRALVAGHRDEMTERDLEELQRLRDEVVSHWEQTIAATAIHYINSVLRDMTTFHTTEYDFYAHAKHWSELKGFSLSLQFSRFSPVSAAEFTQLQDYIGLSPVLPGDAADSESERVARENLVKARQILQAAYAFEEANVGDAQGLGGW